jgi:hypothetical protein
MSARCARARAQCATYSRICARCCVHVRETWSITFLRSETFMHFLLHECHCISSEKRMRLAPIRGVSRELIRLRKKKRPSDDLARLHVRG